jgi:UDP-N-acetylglucosamine:LPS N-acetylglucosamine transferase
MLEKTVLGLLHDRDRLQDMAAQAGALAILDSAEQVAQLIRQWVG